MADPVAGARSRRRTAWWRGSWRGRGSGTAIGCRAREWRLLLGVYRRLVGARIRSDMQYRTSFVLFLISQAVVTGLDLAVIVVLFEVVPELGDWTVEQVAVLYGLTTLSFGIGDVFISQVETAGRYVREGNFDRFLLRPLPTLVQLSASEFALRRVGRSIPALVALLVALPAADIDWTWDRVLIVPVTIVSGTFIFGAVWVVTSSIAFWAIGAQEVANAFTYGGSFAHQYPLHIYARWVRTILGWIVPMAFVAYVPTIHLLDAANPLGLPSWLAAAPPFVAVAATAVAWWVWRSAVSNHQSTGS